MKVRVAMVALVLGTSMLAGCGVPAGTSLASAEATGAVEADRAYSILDMQGIGPVYAAKLRAVGLTNTDKFLAATGDRKSRLDLVAKTGISYKLILTWAHKAELMRINGIGVKQADLLEAVGVNSVAELAQRVPANLAQRVAIANNISKKFVHSLPSEATLTRWIAAAKTLRAQDLGQNDE